MKRLAFLVLATCALRVVAAEQAYILPVVTAKIGDRVYTTTLAARNDGKIPATCEAIYAIPNDPHRATLRGSYAIPSGSIPLVARELLREAGAVGTVRLLCTAPVALATRIQSSADGGATFDTGRTYAAIPEADTIRDTRDFPVTSDLVVAEVRGKPVSFEAIVRDDRGNELARKAYGVPGFAQQIVNLSAVRDEGVARTVEIRTIEGDGAIVAAGETRDGALIAMTWPSQLTAPRSKPYAVAEASRNTAIDLVGAASFKALPFVEPMNGLIYSRDRWYDPRSGSFLSPDPEGFGDSANAFSYCAGDPVNCSDPTGNRAEVRPNGDIVGIRPNKSTYSISASEAKRDPVLALRVLESDPDLGYGDQERIMMEAGLPIPYTSACRQGEACISTNNNRAFRHLPRGGTRGYVEGVFVGAAGLPPATREQQITAGGVEIVRAIATTAGVRFAGTKARQTGGGVAVDPVTELTHDGMRMQVPAPPLGQPMDNVGVRAWYLEQDARMPRLNEQWKREGKSAEVRARLAFAIRQRARITARQMMTDPVEVLQLENRDLAKYGSKNGPTFEWLVNHLTARGYAGDSLYEEIISGAARTDPATNQRLGLEP